MSPPLFTSSCSARPELVEHDAYSNGILKQVYASYDKPIPPRREKQSCPCRRDRQVQTARIAPTIAYAITELMPLISQ
jgi:hypothetical protein